MFLLIANTANPFFYLSLELLSASFILLLVLWYFKDGEKSVLNRHFYIYIAIIVLLQILQSLSYGLFPIKTFLGEYLRIAFAVFAIKILGQAFFEYFVKFVILFAAISLCFYIPSIVFKGFAPFMIKNIAKYTTAPFVPNFESYSNKESIILFNFGQTDLYRNSGFYWEPGAHGGFLIIALFLNMFYRGLGLFTKSSILLLVAILTTLSTTAYLAVFILIIYTMKDFLLKRPLLSVFLFAALLSTSLLLYNKLDFLNAKINKQIEKSENGVPGESRFKSFLADVRILSEHPIIGTGRNIEMKFGKKFYNLGLESIHRNNGVGLLLATYGIFFFLLFFDWIWLSFRKMTGDGQTAALGVLLVLVMGFSEDYFFKVFFIALPLYGCVSFIKNGDEKRLPYKKMQLANEVLPTTIA